AMDDREVLLTRQEVTVAEHGDWAEVELYEAYQNQTWERQEVVYYFSLPESAVITGLWLGDSAERSERFAYRVSPRGAAQAVYRHEVRRRVDPALLEQIGPRQYRLRIFPVEPQRRDWDQDTNRMVVEDGPSLHMWLTYRVLIKIEEGGDVWPLPQLAEKRNVYWDDTSDRLVNGEPMAADEETWLPPAVPATSFVEPGIHRVDFPGGESVIARPASDEDLPAWPEDLHLAVVLDRSRSMAGRQAEVRAALAQLRRIADSDTVVDVYLTASEYHGEEPTLVELSWLDLGSITYAGGQNAAGLLAQFEALHAGQEYAAIFVFTDGSGYELGDGGFDVSVPGAPVWMVHLGDDLPLGYDDATLEAIQASGGGVAGDVREALTRLAVALEGEAYDVVDGYVWDVLPTEAADARDALDGDFAPFAARWLILAEMQRHRGEINELETLDYLHDVAVEYGVVTPYSSMIVLVNERQEKLLDELEARGDRFEREYERVGETEGQNALTVTGVPEPEEWLLLALAAVALALLYLYPRLSARGTLFTKVSHH
ncbi:MAG: PEP-CTERM sorting domain-containing protein, partial [Chloroflexi bacterium]